MSESGRQRPPRATRRFDSAKLAAATRNAEADEPEDAPARAPSSPGAAEGIAMPRAMTVEDPITTQLLAEVARNSHTVDFDEAVIEEAIDKLGDGERPHPHTRRRPRTG